MRLLAGTQQGTRGRRGDPGPVVVRGNFSQTRSSKQSSSSGQAEASPGKSSWEDAEQEEGKGVCVCE